MFFLLLQLVVSQTPLNSGVITALRPELESSQTECATSEPTLTKAVSDTAMYINSLSTVCSFDREAYIAPLMKDYRNSHWTDAVENGGLSCKFVPPLLCDEIDLCSLNSGQCQDAETCSRISAEAGLQQFRTAIAMAEYLITEGHHELAQEILTVTRSSISQVNLVTEGCPLTSTTTTTPTFLDNAILSIPEVVDSSFRSFSAVSTSPPSRAPTTNVEICAPGSAAMRNSWCWDHQYTCESCCNTDYTVGPIRRPCWTPSFTKSACCGIAF